MKYASFGTVSHGTMRPEDLIPDFAWELEHHARENAAELTADQRKEYAKLCKRASKIEDFESEEAFYLLESLFDALNDFAPPYAYFGAHPGDGCDYGFWLSEYFDQQIAEFGIKVSDTSEVPDDYQGEVLHVNDHGNATLYVADHGRLREVWSVV